VNAAGPVVKLELMGEDQRLLQVEMGRERRQALRSRPAANLDACLAKGLLSPST
jgi:hypothetical protein